MTAARKPLISDVISIADTVTTTYGVGGDIPADITAFYSHRIDVTSGSITVGYTNPTGDTVNTIAQSFDSGTLNRIIDAAGVALLSLTATGASEVQITSYQNL